MRTTAKLMCNGLNDEEIVKQIVQQNLFRYPTERSIFRIARACIQIISIGLDDGVKKNYAIFQDVLAKIK